MLTSIAKKIFGSRNDRIIRRLEENVKLINALEPTISKLSDKAISDKTQDFRARLHQGETIEQLLVEAFAVVREASIRALGMRHFDVQLIGGMVLHEGNIAEMRTGEGKTLVATLPAYLNALTGHGVHVVTVNDYLAKRDSEWMKPVYAFLGLSVGAILPDMPIEEKKAAAYLIMRFLRRLKLTIYLNYNFSQVSALFRFQKHEGSFDELSLAVIVPSL